MAEGNGKDKDDRVSQIIIQFARVGSAEFEIRPLNVSSAQMLLAAAWMETSAKLQINQALLVQAQEQARHGLLIPRVVPKQ